jgi:adenylosuccinate synthase
VRKSLRPIYKAYPGWSEDISGVRSFSALPGNARRYVAGMVQAILDVAYEGASWPSTLPNLRYLGVGPGPSQIVKDVPTTAELVGSL